MAHIFISYSRKDSLCVDMTAAHLEQQDFPLWRDKEKIELSANWAASILNALEQADMYLLFWSANARDSKFVQKEMEMAQQRYFSSSLKYVLTVMLDDTPLPAWLSHLQAANFRTGCDGAAVAHLARSLPEALRVYNPRKPLSEQVHTPIEDTPFVSVRVRQQEIDGQRVLRASMVGSPSAIIAKPVRELMVCLQFTGAANQNMLPPVYQTLKRADAAILHIQGPINPTSGRYELDNLDETLWTTAHKFIVDSIATFATAETTPLCFFMLTPNALIGRLSLSYWRFWEIDFYNYAPETGTPYRRVFHVPRNSV